MKDKEKIHLLRLQIQLLLDHVDYLWLNCAPTQMVGAVLPKNIIQDARKALEITK